MAIAELLYVPEPITVERKTGRLIQEPITPDRETLCAELLALYQQYMADAADA